MKKAVFVDRDGTLIEEANYLSQTADLHIFPFTAEAIKLLKENGFLIIVVTNQSGIGRKIFDETAMRRIHEKIQDDLSGKIDGFYFCPHLPDKKCFCRKPNPGMVKAACGDFSIDLKNSWMIGDKAVDVETGFRAGMKTALVLTGYGRTEIEILNKNPDLIAENLLEAVKKIIKSKEVLYN